MANVCWYITELIKVLYTFLWMYIFIYVYIIPNYLCRYPLNLLQLNLTSMYIHKCCSACVGNCSHFESFRFLLACSQNLYSLCPLHLLPFVLSPRKHSGQPIHLHNYAHDSTGRRPGVNNVPIYILKMVCDMYLYPICIEFSSHDIIKILMFIRAACGPQVVSQIRAQP